MHDYLVWYLLEGDKEDRVRGMARNWKRAERMAENLWFILEKVDKVNVVQVGVKKVEHGRLYNENESESRWSVIPPEEYKD